MPPEQKFCGIKHIVIPAADPSGKMTSQQIQNAVGQIVTHLNKNPTDFGSIAYNYSIDPTKMNNVPLNNCLNGVNKADKDQFKAQASQCLVKHVGELDCFKQAEMNKDWVAKVSNMKPGAIDSVFMKELNAFSIIQKPLK